MKNKLLFMKRGSTNFLRFAIFLMGAGVLAFCIFALPEMWQSGAEGFPMVRYATSLIMIGMYMTAIPFFILLWQAIKLLDYIDQGKVFSNLSVGALRNIKKCAAVISILYIGGVPLLFPIADADDAPGMLIIGAVIACIPVTIAVFAAVLEKLLQSAIDIKAENDLTV